MNHELIEKIFLHETKRKVRIPHVAHRRFTRFFDLLLVLDERKLLLLLRACKYIPATGHISRPIGTAGGVFGGSDREALTDL